MEDPGRSSSREVRSPPPKKETVKGPLAGAPSSSGWFNLEASPLNPRVADFWFGTHGPWRSVEDYLADVQTSMNSCTIFRAVPLLKSSEQQSAVAKLMSNCRRWECLGLWPIGRRPKRMDGVCPLLVRQASGTGGIEDAIATLRRVGLYGTSFCSRARPTTINAREHSTRHKTKSPKHTVRTHLGKSCKLRRS